MYIKICTKTILGDLSSGGCNGVTQIENTETTASKLSSIFGLQLCKNVVNGGECVGIAASSPMLVGNSQMAILPDGSYLKDWGQGLSEASNICYKIIGPSGTAIVALTDRCGGYCKCGTIQSSFSECGACVNSPLLSPNCPCVGNISTYMNCAGNQQCDWCASNNHAHFDLDTDTYNVVCGQQGIQDGSCKFKKVEIVECNLGVNWPPIY